MKIFKIALPAVLAVVLLVAWVGLRDAESANLWPKKNGELCWETDTNAVVKLAIVRTYKNHYIVHGTITEYDPAYYGYVRCINGSAEIVDNKVIMHGSTSGIYGDELIGSVGMTELDLATLDGFSEGLNISYNKATAFGEVKYDGIITMTLISCQ